VIEQIAPKIGVLKKKPGELSFAKVSPAIHFTFSPKAASKSRRRADGEEQESSITLILEVFSGNCSPRWRTALNDRNRG